jgi:signal transduction histidine kinase
VKLLEFRAREKALLLTADVDQKIPAVLLGDAARLRQVLFNLVGNALKFTAKGDVRVQVRLLPDQAREPGQAPLWFAVEDTGIGIPADKLGLIFESFRQVDGSTTREYGGTGLGLAICRNLVELMHGRIWVESELGCGSRFQFTAVFAAVQEAGLPAPAPSVSTL